MSAVQITTGAVPAGQPVDRPMLIGGEWVAAASGAWTDVHTPAHRGRVIARVPRGDRADVEAAVAAARAALPGWRRRHFSERQRILLRIADALEARAEELARTTALDTGNALRTQARPEAATLVDLFRFYGGVAGEVKGAVLPAGDEQLQYTRREPYGVVGAVLPWNSPLAIAGYKVPAALAVGNTVVLKAADAAPLPLLLLAEICQELLPPGVLNVLTGPGSTCGEELVRHPGVDKVSFTGSTEVGRRVGGIAGERITPVSLELGGKNPSIVFPDAVHDEALVEGLLLASRVQRQGQSCTAGSRLYVHADVHDEVVARLSAALAAQVVGDPLDDRTDIGAVVNATQFASVCDYVAEGVAAPSVTTVLDGSPPTEGALREGYYLRPTLFTGVDNGWRLAREEIFGPVLVVIPWRDEAEVIRMANDSHYGLAAFVWSHDLDRALRTAHALEAGWVQVNQGGGQVIGQAYGGYKSSGIGREISLEGMLEGFSQTKQINVRLRTT